jgi:hypothetical protein
LQTKHRIESGQRFCIALQPRETVATIEMNLDMISAKAQRTIKTVQRLLCPAHLGKHDALIG